MPAFHFPRILARKISGRGKWVWPRPAISFTALVLASMLNLSAAPLYSVSVRDFGATGDGRTPDTVAIQKAVDTVVLWTPEERAKRHTGTSHA